MTFSLIKKACTLLRIWAFFLSSLVALQPPLTFSEAKKQLLKIYQEHPYTFYCDCPISYYGTVQRNPQWIPENTPESLLRLEWEHIVPASYLGSNLSCWNKYQCSVQASSNRSCCRKTSTAFNIREADLYNLVPAIKLSNSKRSNFRPGIIRYKDKAQRVCKLYIDKKRRIFEPDDDLKGFIARTYLLIADRYHLILTEDEKALFKQWDALYPKTSWEIKRQKLIDDIYQS